ncbi:hypothetical protein GGR32_000460 [Mesonia hippocampi]|uniref:Uncharacterized protein n=1 Tax=Mesonia hippocampi TaxID=1628250 RepID=A0A840ES37_9FLAO|nr:hypothetical protein [Mesonia hippocampi]MBB4118186.1 hypothetical protein [Mesonia hippocampi]
MANFTDNFRDAEKTDSFTEIAVNPVEVRLCSAKTKHETPDLAAVLKLGFKNFLKTVLTFWFVLCQDKMNG